MDRNAPEFDLTGLPLDVETVIRPFAQELVAGLSGRIETIAVTGSCLTGDYIPGVSNINSVLVLGSTEPAELDALALMIRRYRRKHLGLPLVTTEEYIRRSLDVFPIEFFDLKHFHKTIFGPDPFARLAIDKSTLRLQCERDLKGKLINLRQGYLACAGNPRRVKGLLLEAFPGFFPLLRGMLHLVQMQAEPPAGKASVIDEAASTFNLSLAGLKDILLLKAQKRFFVDRKQIHDLFTEVCRITHELSLAMDALSV